MVACQLRITEYKDDLVDIIISNDMNNGKQISRNLKESLLFDSTFYIKTKGEFTTNKFRAIRSIILQNFNPEKLIKKYINITKNYDYFLFANMNKVSQYLGCVLRYRNKRIRFLIFEDGMSSYSNLLERQVTYSKKIFNLKNIKLIISKSIFLSVKGIYVFNPQFMNWRPNFTVIEIAKISLHNREFIEKLNLVFNYNDDIDLYDKDIIFFEEAYYADKLDINDISIVNKLAIKYGKENIFVKIHPRNPENRFMKLGFKTNINTSVPWELVAMNIDLSKKTLITIGSSAVINPFIIMGIEIKSILLFDSLDKRDFLYHDIINVMRKICEKNKRNFTVIKDINKWINNKQG